MNDNEMLYWKIQNKIYNDRKEDKKIRYESWQPARWSSNKSTVEIIRESIGININECLEIGAGSAAFLLELYRQGNYKIEAFDRCSTACNYGKRIAEDMQIPIKYEQKDFFSLDKYKSTDLVLSLGVIEHYSDEEQSKFIDLCSKLSRKYVLIAIPNQESNLFKKYVEWSKQNESEYDDDHKVLTLDMLAEKMEQKGLKILHKDGFQVFLSEEKFWGEVDIADIDIYKKIYSRLSDSDKIKWSCFPKMNFTYEDIKLMAQIEKELTVEERIKNGFMTYVLAEIL